MSFLRRVVRASVFGVSQSRNASTYRGSHHEPDVLVQDILKNPLLSGVTFSGGEPFCQAQALFAVAEKLQGKKHLMAYDGYTWEQLLELPDPGFCACCKS